MRGAHYLFAYKAIASVGTENITLDLSSAGTCLGVAAAYTAAEVDPTSFFFWRRH